MRYGKRKRTLTRRAVEVGGLTRSSVKCHEFGYVFWGRQEVCQKSQRSAALVDQAQTNTFLGRGRRERRYAEGEKEEGLLRTIECGFKN